MSCLVQTYATGQLAIEGLYNFLIQGKTMPPIYTGTGTGYVDDAIGTTTSVFEQITLTFTSATEFTASGSVTGALGSGVVGTLFTSSVFTCTVQAGSTAWAVGDTISFTMTAPWVANVHSVASQYTFTAPGNDNNGGPKVSLLCASDATANYFNAQIVGYPVWQNGLTEAAQFRRTPTTVYWTLGPSAGQSGTLYAVADGKFCYAVFLIGTTYSAMCMGWMTATHPRTLHPQPLLIGGCAISLIPWSAAAVRSPVYANLGGSSWNIPNQNSGVSTGYFLYGQVPPGRWAAFAGGYGTGGEQAGDMMSVSRYRTGSRQQANLDGSIAIAPIELCSRTGCPISSANIFSGNWGILPFAHVMTCVNTDGSLIGGGTIWRDAVTRRRYIAIQNGYVADASNTYALELA